MPPVADFEVEILLPVHNEGASIEATIRGIYRHIDPIARARFIICEDGSRDNSKQVLRDLAAHIPMRLNLSDERKGYSRAVREGMQMLEAPFLLCLDSDGQCDPADFAVFWQNRNTADVLIGWRVHRQDTLTRRAFSRFFFFLYQAAFRVPIHDPSCPYVLIGRSIAHRLAPQLGAMREGFWWEFVARVHRLGFSLREFPVAHRLRAAGVTQVYKWKKMPAIFLRHVAAIGQIWQETKAMR